MYVRNGWETELTGYLLPSAMGRIVANFEAVPMSREKVPRR